MKKYFVYELKKSLFVMFAITIIATAVFSILLISEVDDLAGGYNYNFFDLGLVVAGGGAMSVFVPIWKLAYKMKKRSVDLYYSMPLSHTRILAVKFLVGLIVLFASFTMAYWIGTLIAMATASKYLKLLNCVNFVTLYLSMIIPMAVIYALTAFIFTRANRFIDGVVFVAMTGMALGAIADCITSVMMMNEAWYDTLYEYFFDSTYFTPFGSLALIGQYFAGNMFKSNSSTVTLDAIEWVGIALITALGIAAAVGLFFAERKVKAENCEQISDSYFGYKVMIPLYAFVFAISAARLSFVLVALVAAAAYGLSVLYKRTPKIGWVFAGIVDGAFLAGVIVSVIASA